jgi:hypothetical protein
MSYIISLLKLVPDYIANKSSELSYRELSHVQVLLTLLADLLSPEQQVSIVCLILR